MSCGPSIAPVFAYFDLVNGHYNPSGSEIEDETFKPSYKGILNSCRLVNGVLKVMLIDSGADINYTSTKICQNSLSTLRRTE